MADASAAANPLLLQSRTQQDQPPLKYPPFTLPKPAPLTQSDRELTERSRFLSETFKYSGYYVVPDPSSTSLLHRHSFVSSSFAHQEGAGQQIYTPAFERYSDRYRKILGKKTFYSEISTPNPHLFPPELLNESARIRAATTFTSKVQFLSSKTLANEVARLVAAGSSVPMNDVGDERHPTGGSSKVDGGDGGGDVDGEGRKRGEGEDGDEEEEEQQQEEDEDEDEMEGGDYTAEYGDDDEDGGDAFGDDGDEGETM